MRAASIGAAWAVGAAVFAGLTMATNNSLSAQQGDSPQPQPSTKGAPLMPATEKRSRANPGPLVVACSGAFAKDSSHLKLTMTYDLKNVDTAEVDAGSGKTMASIIFPKEPKRRLEVWWSDQDKRKNTCLIAINGHSNWAGCLSIWMLLPKANQQPRCGRTVSEGIVSKHLGLFHCTGWADCWVRLRNLTARNEAEAEREKPKALRT
jgi:hypothetical protein